MSRRSGEIYHSALSDPLVAEPCRRVEFPDGVAFAHNIANGFPVGEYRAMGPGGIVYGEPPWRSGYDEFQARAGVKLTVPFKSFIQHIDLISSQCEWPVVCVTGRSYVKMFSHASMTFPVTLSGTSVIKGAEAVAVCYHLNRSSPGIAEVADGSPLDALIRSLCRSFQWIGDFACGYGRTGRVAMQEGRRFILSDFDAQCIGVIKNLGLGESKISG